MGSFGFVFYHCFVDILKGFGTCRYVKDFAPQLDSELTQFQHHAKTIELIRSCLGISDYTKPAPISGVKVVKAFYIEPGESLFRFFALTLGGFHVAEMNRDEIQLLVVVPLSGIRRVVEQRGQDKVTLSVEIEADLLRGSGRWESRSGPVGADEGFDRGGLGQLEVTFSSAVYSLEASDPGKIFSISQFGAALRGALSEGL